MRILVVGAGVVGFATGDGLQRFGHDVIFLDIDENRRKWLKDRDYSVCGTELYAPIQHLGEDSSIILPLAFDIIFICVREEHVEEVIQTLKSARAKSALTWNIIVVRSTVNPGTTEYLQKQYALHICHNPEFLTEAQSQWDFLNPGRVVFGECCKEHGDILQQLYTPFLVQIIRTNRKTSEMIKLATNACFASMISFWNEIKQICDRLGVNSTEIGAAVCKDHRISNYGARFHGRPFGGFCLPKDLNHMLEVAASVNYEAPLLTAIKTVNERAGKPCK